MADAGSHNWFRTVGLLLVAIGFFVLAFFFRNFSTPSTTGWIAAMSFILIGVLVRLADLWRPAKPEKGNQDDASQKT
jgi:protein-S-isoprenylcysteine O-methyltransferase Ste14